MVLLRYSFVPMLLNFFPLLVLGSLWYVSNIDFNLIYFINIFLSGKNSILEDIMVQQHQYFANCQWGKKIGTGVLSVICPMLH